MFLDTNKHFFNVEFVDVTEDEPDTGSSCCFAKVLQPDANGHGKCGECFENCTTVEAE